MMLLGYIHIWEGKIADRNYYAFLGLLAGIGFWSHFLIVEFLIPLILFDIFLKKKKRMLIDYGKSLLYFLITFFVGSLPFWIHNIRNHFETFQYYSFNGGTDKIDAIRLIPVTINAFINEAFGPLVLNTSNISQPLSIMVAVIFVAAFFYGLYAIHFAKKVQDNRRGMLIFYSVFFISFLFYDISRYALVEKDVIIRYYIMMIFAIIPILAFFISFLFKYVPYIALFLLFLVISLYTPNLPPRYGINDSVDEILLYLNKQNIHACYWNYAYNYELVLRSMEKTICSPLLDSSVTDRYPEYTRIVQQSSNIAFIINDETLKTKFISSLNKFNLRYVRADVNGIAVFTDIDKSYYDNLLNDWRDE